MDKHVKESRAIRQAELGAARTMIERTEERFGLKPQRLAADSAYGAAPMLNWLVEEKQIAPHVAVLDRSKREDGTFPRQNFRYDESTDTYTCPEGKTLTTTGRINAGDAIFYRSSLANRAKCQLKPRCCPKAPFRRIPRSIYERARDVARSQAGTEAFERSRHRSQAHSDEVRPPKAHPAAGSASLARSVRRPGRVHARSHRPEPQANWQG